MFAGWLSEGWLQGTWPLLPGALGLALLLWATFRAHREQRALLRLQAQPLTQALTVVIPARNEAERIGPTLTALLAEPNPDLRVLVYDDHSHDDTSTIVQQHASKDPRLKYVSATHSLPAGHFGKPTALAAACKEVPQAQLLLFLDADVSLATGSLGALVATLDDHALAALSVSPRLICRSFIEQLLVPAFVALVANRFRPTRIHDPSGETAFLNGQLILVRSSALKDVGGFDAVSTTVLEDVALARRLKHASHTIGLADARLLASTRMYRSYQQLREGFGKNALALHGGPLATGLLAVAGLVAANLPLLSLVLALLFAPAFSVVLAFAIWAGVIGLQGSLRSMMGGARWPAFFSPLVYLIVARVLLGAVFQRELHWRGRRYQA